MTTSLAIGRISLHFSRLVGAQLLSSLVLVVLNLVLASQLGPAGFGTYSLFVAFSAVASLPLVWMSSAVTVYGQEEHIRFATAGRTAFAMLTLGTFAVATVIVILVVAGDLIGTLFPAIAELDALVALYALTVGAMSTVIGVLQARHALGVYGAMLVLVAALPLALVGLGFATIGPLPLVGVAGVVLGQFLAVAMTGVRYLRRVPRPIADLGLLSSMARYAAAYLAGAVQAYVVSYFDILILGLLLSTTAVGHYGFASRMYQQLLLLVQHLATVLLPIVNEQRARGDHAVVAEYVSRRVPQGVAIAALCCVAVSVVGKAVLAVLFAGQYADAQAPFGILSVALFVGIWRRLISPVMTAYLLVWQGNVAALLAAASLVLVALLTVPAVGVAGAALAVLAASTVDLLVALRAVARRLGTDVAVSHLLLMVLGALVVAVPVFTPSAWLPAGGLTVLTAAGFVFLVRRLAVFRPPDVSAVAGSSLPRLIRVAATAVVVMFVAHQGRGESEAA